MWWVGSFQQAPSRKCSARLDALHLDANLTALNHARRKLYDSLESQLMSHGLSVGKACTTLSFYPSNLHSPYAMPSWTLMHHQDQWAKRD